MKNPRFFQRAKQKQQPSSSKWQEYERRKAAWVANNPTSTHAEYTAAMNAICKAVGV